MSVYATIFVMFHEPPSSARVAELDLVIAQYIGTRNEPRSDDFERLVAVDLADGYVEVASDGMLQYYADSRGADRPNAKSIEGRLFKIDYLTRYWEVSRGEVTFPDGPAISYALTLLVLLAQSDVEGVWYGADDYHYGAHIKRLTAEGAHRMIDEFIAYRYAQRGGADGRT